VSIRALGVGLLALSFMACSGAAPTAKVSPSPSAKASPAPSPTPAQALIPSNPDFRYLAAGPGSAWALEFKTGIFRSQGAGPWVGVALPDGSIPIGLFALDDSHVWAVTNADGNLNIFRTANAGASWLSAPVGSGATYPIDLRIRDGIHGVLAAGDQPGTLHATADGGASWTSLSGPPQAAAAACYGVRAAWLHDQTYIGSPGSCTGTAILLYITHDSGSTWQQLSIPQPAWTIFDPAQGYHTGASPVFPSPTDGYAIAAAATCCGGGPAPYWALLTTHDGGVHWTSQVLPHPALATDFSEAPLLRFVLDEGTKAGDQRWSYETRDDGTTLTQLGHLTDTTTLIAFRDQMHGFAAGLFSLVSTADGGRTWTPITP